MGDCQLVTSKSRLSAVVAGWQLIGARLGFFRFSGETLGLLDACWCVSQFDAVLNLSVIAVNFCS